MLIGERNMKFLTEGLFDNLYNTCFENIRSSIDYDVKILVYDSIMRPVFWNIQMINSIDFTLNRNKE
jgi:hypothetical protein